MKRAAAALIRLFPLAILFSCATLPPVRAPASFLGILPPESDLFAYLRVGPTRGLLERLTGREASKDLKLKQVLDRTERVYAGIRLGPPGEPSVSLVALGNFTPGLVSTQLDLDYRWTRFKGVKPYWRHRTKSLELAVPEKGLVLLSAGKSAAGMERLLWRWQNPGPSPVSPEAERELQDADLLFFLPAVPGALPGDQAGLPIQELWLTARRVEQLYAVAGVLILSEEKNPRALQKLLRLLVTAWLRKTGVQDIVPRVKALSIAVDGRTVRVSDLSFSEQDILNAFDAFMGEGGADNGS